jgi:cyclopropane fatty-acyl-phospholipid synthase-like methyltransferase
MLMSKTPDELRERIRDYYLTTTDASYLKSWSPESLGVHFGIDGEGVTTHEESLANTNRFLASALGLTAEMRCLDAGCGVGGTAIWVAEHIGAHVLGINLAENQIAHARRFADARGVGDRTRFEVMDYAQTSLLPISLDAVWNLESLCHASAPGAVLSHLASLLRPGGTYACLDFFRGHRGDPENVRELCEGWVLPSFMTFEEAQQAVEATGLHITRATDETERVLRSASTLIQMANARRVQLEFQRAFMGGVDPIYDGHTRAALGCSRGFYDGSVTYGLIVASKS